MGICWSFSRQALIFKRRQTQHMPSTEPCSVSEEQMTHCTMRRGGSSATIQSSGCDGFGDGGVFLMGVWLSTGYHKTVRQNSLVLRIRLRVGFRMHGTCLVQGCMQRRQHSGKYCGF